MKKLCLSMMILLMPLIAFAAKFVELNGIYYNLADQMGTAEVVKSPNKYKGSITIPESVTYGGKTYRVTIIGYTAFSGCKELTSIVLPNCIEVFEDYAFQFCTKLTSFTFPNSLKKIGNYAFQNCTHLKSIDIPNSVESIGVNSFCGCWDLNTVRLSNSLLLIDTNTFSNCKKLSSITIPNSVKKINYSAFFGCNKLTKVVIGENVSEIENHAFANCSDLTDVYCYVKNVYIGKYTFENSYIEYATLHVPSGSLDFYQNAYNWSDFGKIVALTDNDPKPTAITTITLADDNDIKCYTIDGKPISKPQKGINILKYGNGTTKKVVIR